MSGRLEKMPLKKLLEIVRDDFSSTPKAREIAAQEILRRSNQSLTAIKRIKEELAKIESDERLGYPTATVIENAPLALVQCGLENQRRAIKWVLFILEGAA
jgi:hypothetical protein